MKNQLNGLLGILGTVTYIFTAIPASAQTTTTSAQATNVPFIGGNVNITVDSSGLGKLTGRGVTPFGAVTFTDSADSKLTNNTRDTINTVANIVNDQVALTAKTNGTFDSTNKPFSSALTTILGSISFITGTTTAQNLTISNVTGGITLPNEVLGIEARTFPIPISSGVVRLESNFSTFDTIKVEFINVVTSRGPAEINSANFSSLKLADNLGLIISPGSYRKFIEPAGNNDTEKGNNVIGKEKIVDISGISTGVLDLRKFVGTTLTQTNAMLDNVVFNIKATPSLPIFEGGKVNGLILNIIAGVTGDITKGSNFFVPNNFISKAENMAIDSVIMQPVMPERDSNPQNPTTTVNIPAPSALASSSVHPDVTNVSAIQVKSEQIRANTGGLLGQNRISEAFSSIESGQNSLLSAFTGVNLNSRILSIDESLKEVTRVSQLSSSQTAVIYPVILKDRLEILAILPAIQPSETTKGSPARTVRTSVPVPEEALIEVIARFRDNLQDPNSSAYLVESRLLYNLLIRPIEAELQASEIKTLVFAMDGDFRSIPVAALNDGNKFLIQKYATATVPSLGMANTNLSTITNRRATTILALGLTDAIQGFSALPNVKTEIVTIGSKILSGETFLNQDFTVENLQAQRRKQDYGIIHLATHAEFDVDDAQDSFVLFWDKKVRSGQIPKLRLDKLELLTLSACQTAVGNNLGLSGLAVASGVKSVLASLWSVSDAGTAPLMMKFYSLYPDAPSKAIALQQAQIALIEGTVKIENKSIKGIPQIGDIPLSGEDLNVNLKHPYFWSSFILIGNWL